MIQQRTGIFGAVLAAAVAAMAAGIAAQPQDGQRMRTIEVAPAQPATRGAPDRDVEQFRFVVPGTPADRRAIRLDGRGSQIGVMVSDVEAPQSGVRIDGVDEDGPAGKAGVQDGDLVVDFDGERVRSARQLTRLVQETPEGRAVKMTVARGDTRQTLDITPASSPLTWNMELPGPGLHAEIEQALPRLRELPQMAEPMLNFRFDGLPMAAGRGVLGVQVEPVSGQLAEYFGAKDGGVLVSSVTKDSPADKAGVKAGDVITAVNGTPVRETDSLVAELAQAASGNVVTLGLVRDKKATTAKATIERPRPARPGRSARPA